MSARVWRLKKLQILSLVYCELLTALPETIGQLTNLRELSAGYTKLKALPRSIGKCRSLEKLSVGRSNITSLSPVTSTPYLTCA